MGAELMLMLRWRDWLIDRDAKLLRRFRQTHPVSFDSFDPFWTGWEGDLCGLEAFSWGYED